MTHPCQFYSCWDNVHGECFGGGCKRNPIKDNPAEGGEGEREDEVSEEYETENGSAAELP